MTTQGTMYGDFDSNPTQNAVLLQFQGDVVEDGLLPAPGLDPLTGEPGVFAQLYKGGSDQWFVTYELGLDSSEDDSCPQVTRVYLSGELRGWELGTFKTRSGAPVYGVKIQYDRTHESYRLRDDGSEYETGARSFAKVIELPVGATNVQLRSALPDRYRHALHR
jgi:hypothetical protein